MGAPPSRVWIDFHLLSYHWWFLFLRWHRRFLELNFYRDCEQLLPLHGVVVHFLVLWHVSKHRQVSKDEKGRWKRGCKAKAGWATVEGIACLRTADCAVGFMLTQAVSKPLPWMACRLAAFMACDVKRALRLLGRNGWDCELQRHSHLSLEVTTGIGRSVVHLTW